VAETSIDNAPAEDETPRSARLEAVEEVARSYFEAVGRRDPDAMAELWHADGVEDIVPLGVFRGPEGVRTLFRETFAAMPDFELHVDRITVDEEVAAVQWHARGTFSGSSFQGIEPTGGTVELRGVDCLQIDEDGLITSNFAVYDGAAFARGIGMLPPLDSTAEKVVRSGFNAVTRLRGAVSGLR
jgi:steroid delta-isomerase-like uncharacterized protein